MVTFKAIRIDKDDGGQQAAYVQMSDDELMDGDVDIEIAHSTLNYKDGLAITGRGPVVRRFPMIPGVDFTGRVTASTHRDFRPGDFVVAGGCGLGEAHYGGLAEKARVSGRMARSAARQSLFPGGNDHRNGWRHGHVLCDGAGAVRPDARPEDPSS